MGLHVGTKVGAIREGSLALRAPKRLFPCVSPNVTLEEPRARKGFPTYGALAREGVSSDVHLEGSKRHVDLVAVLAREGFLLRLLAMELPMFGESGEGGVGS